MGLIIGILGGGVISWVIAHYYYEVSAKKTKKQNKDLQKKLSKEVKKIVLNSKKDDLSVIELNKILEDKTIDTSEIGKDPLPYIACPKCGSKNLDRNSMTDYRHDEIYYMITCEDCGWSTGTQ